jgi:hypothetical protein
MRSVFFFFLSASMAIELAPGAWSQSKKGSKKEVSKKTTQPESKKKPSVPDEPPPEGVFTEEELRNAHNPKRAADWPGYAQ